MSVDSPDPVIVKARAIFKASGKTLDELGVLMGAESGTARRSAWQFLNKVGDPRISSLRKFCDAMDIPLADLIDEKSVRPSGRTPKMPKKSA